MPGYKMKYGSGGSYKSKRKKKAQMGTGKVPKAGYGTSMRKARGGMGMGASGMTMPNDVMSMIRAQQGKSTKGAMKLFNALAKKLGKKVK